MKWMCTVTTLLLLAVAVQAEPWKVDMETGVGITQSSFSDNWSGGDAGNIIWIARYLGRANRQVSSSWFSGNELKLAFGQSHTQSKASKKWAAPTKADDKIRYDGVAKLTKNWIVDPYLGLTIETQFIDQSPVKSEYPLNPFEVGIATGIARHLLNQPEHIVLTTRFGAGIRRKSIKFETDTTSGASKTEIRTDGGAEWVTDLLAGSTKGKYSYNSKLTVFKALYNSKKPPTDDWKAVDANWDNTLSASVNSLLQVSLLWQLLYDKEIARGGQFKETLSLGIAYKFSNAK